MEEFENRYIIGRPAEVNEPVQTPQELIKEKERHAKQLSILDLFGKIDYHPDYDYKEARRLRTQKLEKLYAELDQDISALNVIPAQAGIQAEPRDANNPLR